MPNVATTVRVVDFRLKTHNDARSFDLVHLEMLFSVMEISPVIITPIIKQVGRAVVSRNNYAFISRRPARALLSHLCRLFIRYCETMAKLACLDVGNDVG